MDFTDDNTNIFAYPRPSANFSYMTGPRMTNNSISTLHDGISSMGDDDANVPEWYRKERRDIYIPVGRFKYYVQDKKSTARDLQKILVGL